jgi:hypothetical protein
MVEGAWNMQTNFKKNSLPTKVGLIDQPNTQIDNKAPKKVHFETKLNQCQILKPILQQPSFFIAPYRTIPLNPLPILPVPKWKHAYMHITSKVDSYRK